MKINEFDKEVTQKELDILEMYIDKVFNKVGIDVEFTRHFLDRVNDERNRTQITIKELGQLFAKEYKRWGKPIAQLGPDAEAVMKDISTDINIPFALNWDREKNQLELVAKTVMRKKNFKTPNREFPVESIEEPNTLTEETIGNFADNIVKSLNKSMGLSYEHPRWGTTTADTFTTQAESGKGSRNQKSRGVKIIWSGNEAAHQTGKDRGEIRKNARKLVDAFLAKGTPINVKSRVFGDPSAAYKFGNIIVLDEDEYLLVFTSSKLKSTQNYQTEQIDEDLGSIPPLTDLIVMAVVGQTTVAALKAAYKTGKYALKLKRLADKAGVKLNNAVMGESFSSEMNKASKKAHADAAEKRKKMGPVTSDTLADINAKLGNTKSSKKKTDEAINRDEYAAKLAMQQKDKFFKAALAALDRLVKSDPRGQSVGGYAFDIARAFSGVNARELERTYAETHGKK